MADALIKMRSVDPVKQTESQKKLLEQVLDLKTSSLGRHKLGEFVLAVEQLAPRLVAQPDELRRLSSYFYSAIVVYSKTGKQLELRTYLQPTLIVLKKALDEAYEENNDLELKRQMEYIGGMIDRK